MKNETRTYTARCICGAVRISAELDLSQAATRCNCTACRRTGAIGLNAKLGSLKILSGQQVLGDYSTSEYGHARFCTRCGIRVFAHGNIPEAGGEYQQVNLNCLEDVNPDGMTVRYLDGLNNTWAELAVVPYMEPVTQAIRASSVR